jgi:signal peptidase I
MFGIFTSQKQKVRQLAADWIELADKVERYRRDVLPQADLENLQRASGNLRKLLREKADSAALKLGIDSLEAALRKTGGAHYPKSGLVENVEFFLVAAIVILGLRAFYIQPFKIPTNSMWPSYYGMTGQVYQNTDSEPGSAERAFRFITTGAQSRRVDAPDSGEVLLPIGANGGRGVVAHAEVSGRSWFVLPTKLREYTLFAGQRTASVRVPLDFDMDWVLRDAYFPDDHRPLSEIVRDKLSKGEVVVREIRTAGGTFTAQFVKTGRQVKAGERMLSFDILTGDQLFVDRVSYHFVRPSVGDGFVFRTDHIDSPYMRDRVTGKQVESYYIKRLTGLPGDRLRIADYTLFRNGAPITGSDAFDLNAKQLERYSGYRDEGLFRNGAEVTLEAGQYMALGDNSANSLDGRYWGTVAGKDIVGRPLFIYYPFTNRWGPAP